MSNEFDNNILTGTPPYDPDAEMAVVSSVLFDPAAIETAYELLIPDDFYRHDYKACYAAMIELFTTNKPIDFVTLKNRLEERGEYEQIGGRDLFASIATASSTSANIAYYAKIVAEKAVRRKLIALSRTIESACRDGAQNIDSIMEQAEKGVFDISQSKKSRDYSHIRDVLFEAIEKIEEVSKNNSNITGIPTGLTDFDSRTAGLHNSDLILIAARPSMGKTMMGLTIALNAAVEVKVPTAFFSLEMSNVQIVQRLLSSYSMVEANKLRTGNLSGNDGSEWPKIVEAIGPLSDAPLFLDDSPSISISELRAKCRRLKLEQNIGLIIIDYLQLMSGSSGRNESRQQEVSEISRSLKALARELNVPVIALSQLSRAVESRQDKHPMLSDLRESGAIEQDADLVCFLYREDYYNPETEKKGVAEIIISKQRNGETGTVDVRFWGKFLKFANLEYSNTNY